MIWNCIDNSANGLDKVDLGYVAAKLNTLDKMSCRKISETLVQNTIINK